MAIGSRSCFFYCGPQPTAESLWKVYEVIRDAVGGGDKGRGKAKIEGRGWATPEEIDGFRGVHPSVELLQPEPAVRVLDCREDLDVRTALAA